MDGSRARHRTPSEQDVLGALSAREREVFQFIVRGFKNREVGRELCIDTETVETHRQRLYRKLKCSSAIGLMQFALKNGLLPGAETTRPVPEFLPFAAQP